MSEPSYKTEDQLNQIALQVVRHLEGLTIAEALYVVEKAAPKILKTASTVDLSSNGFSQLAASLGCAND